MNPRISGAPVLSAEVLLTGGTGSLDDPAIGGKGHLSSCVVVMNIGGYVALTDGRVACF